MVDGLTMTATVKAQEQMAERVEKELIGAWRAGYDYLYVAPDITSQREPTHDKSELTLSLSYRVLPTHYELSHNPFEAPMEQFNLKDLTVAEYKDHT